MTQLLLDDPAQRDRVRERIAHAILFFATQRCGEDFFMEDLRRFIARDVGPVAPASPDRILRDLRQRGKLKYEVVDRQKSLYHISEVAKEKDNV